MTIEQKYFISLSELENTYIKHTKGSITHKILRNNIQNYVEYLEKQLQEKDEILRNIREIFNDQDNSFSDGCDCKKIEDLIEVEIL